MFGVGKAIKTAHGYKQTSDFTEKDFKIPIKNMFKYEGKNKDLWVNKKMR